MNDHSSIWLLDEVTTKPGQGPAFLDAYMRSYVPAATQRGMTLAYRMVEPAMWRDDAPNRILLVWKVPNAGAVWGSKHGARHDPAVSRWWQEEAPAFLVERKRSILADASHLPELGNV